MSTEIVRNLMERYDAGPAVAKAMGIDMNKDPMWRQHASIEVSLFFGGKRLGLFLTFRSINHYPFALQLERAVLNSFQKNGFTIVDPITVGEQFCMHVRREREQFGRECPGQWSWIGGLVGPTNPTWHLEMRDFLVNPQYEYSAHGLTLHTALRGSDDRGTASVSSGLTSTWESEIPRPLIVFGSETGKAEVRPIILQIAVYILLYESLCGTFNQSAARRLKRELRLLKPTVMSLNDAAGLEIVVKRRMTHVIGICSTFGKGEPPNNAEIFMKTDIADVVEASNAKFTVLALGSSLYPDFCKAGVQLDSKLANAGLNRFATLAKADDAAGGGGVVSNWISLMKKVMLPSSLEAELTAMSSLDCDADAIPEHSLKFLGGSEQNINGSPDPEGASMCLSNVELLPEPDESNSIRKIVFSSPSPYVSGDHLAV